MTKFYATKSFKTLNDEWRAKLKESGFEDIECTRGHLKQHDRRTIAFQNRDTIAEFFSKLGEYLNEKKDLAETERKILDLYSQGLRIRGKESIVALTGLSDSWCREVIRKHKVIILRDIDKD